MENYQGLKMAEKFDEEFKIDQVEKKEIKQKSKKKLSAKFKEDYFAFYDDIKSPSLKKQDW